MLALIASPAVQASEAADAPMAGLDARLTGRAIRDVAGHPSLAAQAGSAEAAHGPSLAAAIARARVVSLVEAGIETSKTALLDCLQDESRGQGLGLAGLPRLSTSALADHCHR